MTLGLRELIMPSRIGCLACLIHPSLSLRLCCRQLLLLRVDKVLACKCSHENRTHREAHQIAFSMSNNLWELALVVSSRLYL